ncbi:hypothetical protein M2271_004523 [Streptomyces sp. LBL]|nr:hypothetical protein [Streptomyces sp. LBL]
MFWQGLWSANKFRQVSPEMTRSPRTGRLWWELDKPRLRFEGWVRSGVNLGAAFGQFRIGWFRR